MCLKTYSHEYKQFEQQFEQHVVTLRKIAGMTIETLTRCRDQSNFENVWQLTAKLSEKIKSIIKDSEYEFKEPTSQRPRKVSRRLQALVGEEESDNCMLEM